MLFTQLELIEGLNKKTELATQLVEENKQMIIEKLAQFEHGVIKELKDATEHLDLKAYDATFNKLEKDIDNFYQEIN